MPIQTDTGPRLTYEDYVKIPSDGLRHEVIEGRHIVSAAPRTIHQVLVGKMYIALHRLEQSGHATVLLSPIDVQLSPTDIVQPDVIAIAAARTDLIGELKIDGPPDLVVEILSPSTERSDRGAKRALYESAGVAEYWILDPQLHTLTQLSLVEARYVEHVHRAGPVASTVFPGFVLEFDDWPD